MKIVAVTSNVRPRLRNNNTYFEIDLLLCSLMIPIVYDNKAKKTMMVPISTSVFKLFSILIAKIAI